MQSFPHHMPMPTDHEINHFLGGPSSSEAHGSTADMPSLPEVDQWLQAKDREEKYGGVGGQIASGLTGLASGATLGLSNVALTKTGLMKPETLKGLQEENPVSYGLGELGSVLVPGGAIEQVGKVGKAIYEGAQGYKAIKNLGAVGKIGSQALGSAVEGAAFSGIDNSLNEYALGDPDLNAEKVMSHMGYGAMFGGALGGILKTASIGAPPALQAGKEGLSWIKNKIMGQGEGEQSLATKGLDFISPEGKLSDAFANRAKNLDKNQQEELIRNTTDQLNTVKNNFSTAQKDLNATLRPAERNALIETADPKKVGVATQDVIDQMNQQMEMMKAAPGEFSNDAVSKLDRWHTQLANGLKNQSPSDRMELLKDIKQGLQKWGYGFQSETKAATQSVMQGLSKHIGDILHDPDIFGMAGASEAAHDSLLHEVYKFIPPGRPKEALAKDFKKAFLNINGDFDPTKVKKFLAKGGPEGDQSREMLDSWFQLQQKLPEHFENTYANVPNDLWDKTKLDGVMDTLGKTKGNLEEAQSQYQDSLQNAKGSKLGMRDLLLGGLGASHPALGAAAFAADIASRPIEYINKLAEVERILGKSADALEKGAKSVFDPSLKAIGKMKGILTKKYNETDVDAHQHFKDSLSQLNNNPPYLIDKLHASTSKMNDVAPNMAQSVQATMIRANQFLQSKMSEFPESTNPFEDKFVPSKADLSRFDHYMNLIENPMLAFDHVEKGTITPDTVETLTAVYPKLYQEMKSSLLNEATDRLARKETVPFKLKQSMSMFLGQPLDASFSPQSIANNQMLMNQMPQPTQGASKSGMKGLTLAERSSPQKRPEA